MKRELDLRGARCPVPLIRARSALPALASGDALVIYATDPEAPVDLGALAADERLAFAVEREGEVLRITLSRR